MELTDQECLILEEMHEMFSKMSEIISSGLVSDRLKDHNLTIVAKGDQVGEYAVLLSLEDCIIYGKQAIVNIVQK